MSKSLGRRKPRSLKGLYRWLKRYYLPAIHRKIEMLPREVALLANRVDKTRPAFFIL